MYKIQLDKNGTILKKVFLSLPKGVFDLKAANFSGTMDIDSDSYIYAMKHGLKDLLRNEIVKVTVKPVKQFTNKAVKKNSVENKAEKSVVAEVSVLSNEAVEQTTEQTAEPVVEEASEQPKKKSKKKK